MPTVSKRRSVRKRPEAVNYVESDVSEFLDEEFTLPQKSKANALSDDELVITTDKNQKAKKRKLNKVPRASREEFYKELEENLVENEIFEDLNDSSIDVIEIASNWIEEYENASNRAFKDLINLALRSSGCLSQVAEHDVSNVEVAPGTVSEIQNWFYRQHVHEFPLIRKGRQDRVFKKRFEAFIRQIILIGNERSVLIKTGEESEDGELLENVLIWLTSLSTSNIRALRYVSTSILLNIETSICEILVNFTKNYDKNQENLKLETQKAKELARKLKGPFISGRDKNKVNKELDRSRGHVVTLQQHLEFYDESKNGILEYIGDIFSSIFTRRFKDVDPLIRIECIGGLYRWIELCPEIFFDQSYVRYLGWLILDKDVAVKVEALKVTVRLYKKYNGMIVSGLRQFTERLTTDVIGLLNNEKDVNVRIQSLYMLIEINKLGFLQEEEVLELNKLMVSIISRDTEDEMNELNKVPKIAKRMKDDGRLLDEFVRLMSQIEEEKSQEIIEQYKLNSKQKQMVELQVLIGIVKEGITEGQRPGAREEKENVYLNQVGRIGFLLYRNISKYAENWRFIVEYLTTDVSEMKVGDEVMRLIELSQLQQYYLLSLLYGIVYGIVSKVSVNYYLEGNGKRSKKDRELKEKAQREELEKEEREENERKIGESKMDDEESNEPQPQQEAVEDDEQDAQSDPRDLDKVYSYLIDHLPVLFSEFSLAGSLKILLQVFLELIGIEKFKSYEQANSLNSLIKSILKIFKQLNYKEIGILKLQFRKFFAEIKSSVDSHELTIELKLLIQNVIIELCLEFNQGLESSQNIEATLEKLLIIGEVYNISEFTAVSSIDYIAKILKNVSEHENYKMFFQFLFIYCSWKIERLYQYGLTDSLFLDMGNVTSGDLSMDQADPSASYLFKVPEILDVFGYLLTSVTNTKPEWYFNLQVEAAKCYIDIFLSVRLFITKFQYDDRLAKFLDERLRSEMPESIEKNLIEIYLNLEGSLARTKNVQLDHDDDEGVSYGYDVGDEREQQAMNSQEEQLIEYTLKLIELIKAGIFDGKLVARLRLNQDALGGLYKIVVEKREKKVVEGLEIQDPEVEAQQELERGDAEIQVPDSPEIADSTMISSRVSDIQQVSETNF